LRVARYLDDTVTLKLLLVCRFAAGVLLCILNLVRINVDTLFFFILVVGGGMLVRVLLVKKRLYSTQTLLSKGREFLLTICLLP
jgi:hypothetical protein